MNPKRFITSTPHLPVINLRQTLDYYRDTLGFCEEWTEGKKDGAFIGTVCLCFLLRSPYILNKSIPKMRA